MEISKDKLPHNYAKIVGDRLGFSAAYVSNVYRGTNYPPRTKKTIEKVKKIKEAIKELSEEWLAEELN